MSNEWVMGIIANSGNWAYVVNITTTNQQQPASTNQPTPNSQ
ncbi:hypothetical protein [Brunnivagina elsteri]|nr:hypothetical protein [Calothrix elsteri]